MRRIALFMLLLVAGCVQGGGGPVTSSVPPERSRVERVRDESLSTTILKALNQSDSTAFRAVSATVLGNRVMLTGAVVKPEHRRRAEHIAAAVDGVAVVENNLLLAEVGAFHLFTPDTVRERDLTAQLAAAGDVATANYSLRMVNGAVYLLGNARSPAELERIKALLIDQDGVKWVDAIAVTVP